MSRNKLRGAKGGDGIRRQGTRSWGVRSSTADLKGFSAVSDTNVFQLSQPGTFTDPLTAVLRNGARALLAQAVEAEAAALLASHADNLTADGRRRLVRHGHLPEREVMPRIRPGA